MTGRRCRTCSAGPLVACSAARRARAAGHRVPRRAVHAGRGLCESCHDALYRAGLLEDFPRVTRPSAELVADAEILRARNPEWWTWAKVAAELGVTPAALERARRRVRHAAKTA